MSFFSNLVHVFKPVQHVVEQAGHELNPQHIVDEIDKGVHKAIQAAGEEFKKTLPHHITILGKVKDKIELVEPSYIKFKIFIGVGFEVGVELQAQFGLSIAIDKPVERVDAIQEWINNPPATCHELCDKLWAILPSEISVDESLQAVVGEEVEIGWEGEDVVEHLSQYLGASGMLDKPLR